MLIRPLRYPEDIAVLPTLWKDTLIFAKQNIVQGLWECPPTTFWEALCDTTREGRQIIGFVGEEEGVPVGVIVGQVSHASPTVGSLAVLLVSPHFQRQGRGTQLLHTLEQAFSQNGVETVHFARGSEPYLWQGIPDNLPGAQAFFQKRGWNLYETSWDLTQDIRGYTTPDWVRERAKAAGATFRLATPNDAEAIAQFEQHYFPEWSGYFAEVGAKGRWQSIVLAEWDGEIAGTALIEFAPDCSVAHWETMLTPAMCGIACVGVGEPWRERGIGSGLVSFAAETLREQGGGICLIHWTWLAEWYGKLGFTVWQTFQMASKTLSEPVASQSFS
jgi:GNAT superfamily N-acetyltransferase